MKDIIYYHKTPQSFQSKLIQKTMAILGMSKKMEKKIVQNSYRKTAVKIPKSIFKKYDVKVFDQDGRKVWEIEEKGSEAESIILYLHGGAYYANIIGQHWLFIKHLLVTVKAKIIVPDYPLAPESGCLELYQFMDALYERLITNHPNKRIILMGDSSGGGIALGFAQRIRNEDIKQATDIVLFSPWLDVSMRNPEILKYEKNDKILSLAGLKYAGEKYAKILDLKDYRVSPIYGNFKDLGNISVFIGTNDMLIADARKFKQLLKKEGIPFNYFEYPHMFHDWAIITSLTESVDVISKVGQILNKS